MDKHEVVKTVITIVLTVVAKECLSGLVSWLKKTVTSKAIRAILRATITRNRMFILFDLIALSGAIYILLNHARKNHPLNQWEVIFICIYTANALFWLQNLFRDSTRALEERIDRKDRRQLAQ